MPTQTTAKDAAKDAAEPVRELTEQVADFNKKAGLQYLEAYETNMNNVADFHEKVADTAQVEWVANAARANAKLTREMTKVYVSTTRDLLK